ncbi:MAG: sulfite exporter TauE/SafE family protein [Bacteroidia bacterium]
MTIIIILLCIGLLAGILSGLIGIGGGIIIVPALVYFLGSSQHQAQGTSLAVLLLPVGILAVYAYYKAGYVNLQWAGIMAIGFVFGGFIGSKISIGIDEQVLKKIFAMILVLIAIKILLGK